MLDRKDNGAVATLTLNAPERLNALSDEMIAALLTQIELLGQDRSIRAVVLKGAGKAFCAGHDLKQMTAARQSLDGGRAAFEDLFSRCATMMQGLIALPQPVIAQVHGVAAAAGCQLVATCDMAIAAEEARFGVNGVNIGLFCSTPMVALSRNIPLKQAFETLVTGDFLSAQRAAELGLINRAVPASDLETATQELAARVADKLGAAVKIGKEAFYKQIEMPLDQAYAFTGEAIVQNMLHRETEAGIAAFLEKRPHEWTQD